MKTESFSFRTTDAILKLLTKLAKKQTRTKATVIEMLIKEAALKESIK